MIPYLTVSDVAKLYSVKEITIRDWVHKGKMPAVKIGGTNNRGGLIRFRQQDIDDFNNTNCTQINNGTIKEA
ncbi:MAG: Helix-turn-helix domain [Firmicutes bacterium]|nr:Helix-turn-helix domain [Bacillota bacterium]